MVELQDLRAVMEMQDKISYDISAKVGFYDSRTEMLTLQHNIVVTSSDGFQARLSEAAVDIKSGKIVSEKSVEVKGLQWAVTSDRLEVTDSGAFIRFDRGVTMTLMPMGDAPRFAGARRAQ